MGCWELEACGLFVDGVLRSRAWRLPAEYWVSKMDLFCQNGNQASRTEATVLDETGGVELGPAPGRDGLVGCY